MTDELTAPVVITADDLPNLKEGDSYWTVYYLALKKGVGRRHFGPQEPLRNLSGDDVGARAPRTPGRRRE
jgi:hypothetical protein